VPYLYGYYNKNKDLHQPASIPHADITSQTINLNLKSDIIAQSSSAHSSSKFNKIELKNVIKNRIETLPNTR
jgi:hypothetical protein